MTNWCGSIIRRSIEGILPSATVVQLKGKPGLPIILALRAGRERWDDLVHLLTVTPERLFYPCRRLYKSLETAMDRLENDAPELQEEDAPQRKPYTTPVMTDFGSVAEVTRGTFLDYHIGS